MFLHLHKFKVLQKGIPITAKRYLCFKVIMMSWLTCYIFFDAVLSQFVTVIITSCMIRTFASLRNYDKISEYNMNLLTLTERFIVGVEAPYLLITVIRKWTLKLSDRFPGGSHEITILFSPLYTILYRPLSS